MSTALLHRARNSSPIMDEDGSALMHRSRSFWDARDLLCWWGGRDIYGFIMIDISLCHKDISAFLTEIDKLKL